MKEDKYVGNMPHYKTPGKNGENNEPNKNLISPKIPGLNEYGIIGVIFLLLPQEYYENLPQYKIPGKNGGKVNLTNMGSPIHPGCQYLLNTILMVANLFC